MFFGTRGEVQFDSLQAVEVLLKIFPLYAVERNLRHRYISQRHDFVVLLKHATARVLLQLEKQYGVSKGRCIPILD